MNSGNNANSRTNMTYCDKLTDSYINQGTKYGTCWFASTLNGLFYSENIRYLLLPTIAQLLINYNIKPLCKPY